MIKKIKNEEKNANVWVENKQKKAWRLLQFTTVLFSAVF